MDIHEDICHFCSERSRVITNGKSYVKIIRKVLSGDILNYPEFTKVKSLLKTCLICSQKLVLIEKTSQKIENATVNKHFNCLLCNDDEHLVQIQNWDYLNTLLEGLDCNTKIKKYKVCLECFYFLSTIHDFKSHLFKAFPQLEFGNNKLSKNESQEPPKIKSAPKNKPQSPRPKRLSKSNSNVKDKLKDFNPLCKSPLFENDAVVSADDKLYNKVPLILIRHDNLEQIKSDSERQWNLIESDNESPEENKVGKLTLRLSKRKILEESGLDFLSTSIEDSLSDSSPQRSRRKPSSVTPNKTAATEDSKDNSESNNRRPRRSKDQSVAIIEPESLSSDIESPVKNKPRLHKKKSSIVSENQTIQERSRRSQRTKEQSVIIHDSESEEELSENVTSNLSHFNSKKPKNNIDFKEECIKHNIVKTLFVRLENNVSPLKRKKRKFVTFKEDNMVEYFPSSDIISNLECNPDAGHTPKPSRKRRLSITETSEGNSNRSDINTDEDSSSDSAEVDMAKINQDINDSILNLGDDTEEEEKSRNENKTNGELPKDNEINENDVDKVNNSMEQEIDNTEDAVSEKLNHSSKEQETDNSIDEFFEANSNCTKESEVELASKVNDEITDHDNQNLSDVKERTSNPSINIISVDTIYPLSSPNEDEPHKSRNKKRSRIIQFEDSSDSEEELERPRKKRKKSNSKEENKETESENSHRELKEKTGDSESKEENISSEKVTAVDLIAEQNKLEINNIALKYTNKKIFSDNSEVSLKNSSENEDDSLGNLTMEDEENIENIMACLKSTEGGNKISRNSENENKLCQDIDEAEENDLNKNGDVDSDSTNICNSSQETDSTRISQEKTTDEDSASNSENVNASESIENGSDSDGNSKISEQKEINSEEKQSSSEVTGSEDVDDTDVEKVDNTSIEDTDSIGSNILPDIP